jgi:protein-tyrosine phosphatase
MPNVLFVCSVNRFRSVIAAECFRSLLQKNAIEGKWVVGSAGTRAMDGFPPLSQAISFAKSKGVNIEDIRSREVNQSILEDADLIIVMVEGHREAMSFEFPQVKKRILLLSEICEGQSYDIPDPVEENDETPDKLAAEIWGMVNNGFSRICMQAQTFSERLTPNQ